MFGPIKNNLFCIVSHQKTCSPACVHLVLICWLQNALSVVSSAELFGYFPSATLMFTATNEAAMCLCSYSVFIKLFVSGGVHAFCISAHCDHAHKMRSIGKEVTKKARKWKMTLISKRLISSQKSVNWGKT